jgi:uncharacterized membrane protein YoaK (UPF0700 family)
LGQVHSTPASKEIHVTSQSRSPEDYDAAFRSVVPPALSFVSGYVDTIGFLGLFGLLTSQVTGAFIAAGAAFVQREQGLVPKLLAMPMFMVGACLLTLLVAVLRRCGADAMPYALTFVGALIALFLGLSIRGQPFATPDAPAALGAAISAFIAMGAQSALVRVLFKGSLPANFMTGNVTQVAVETTDLVLASIGLLHPDDPAADSARMSAARTQLKILLPMILCFIAGAVVAAHAFLVIGFWSLLLATGLVMLAALWAPTRRV